MVLFEQRGPVGNRGGYPKSCCVHSYGMGFIDSGNRAYHGDVAYGNDTTDHPPEKIEGG